MRIMRLECSYVLTCFQCDISKHAAPTLLLITVPYKQSLSTLFHAGFAKDLHLIDIKYACIYHFRLGMVLLGGTRLSSVKLMRMRERGNTVFVIFSGRPQLPPE